MIVLDYRDKRPLYEQVFDKLEHLIICGALEANSKLPSVRNLAFELSINANTVQRAYTQLEQEGYIYTVIGRGNYVTCEKEWRNGKMKSLRNELITMITSAKTAGITINDLEVMINEIYTSNLEEQE